VTDPEHSKQTVIAYLNTAFNDKQPAEAVENYGGSHYIQHNPKLLMASRLSSSS
jgi:predicted SnoaL-like aldol condensation-catalyzing enzyme